MYRKEVEDKVFGIAREVSCRDTVCLQDTMKTLDIDSLDEAEFIMYVEDILNIELDAELLGGVTDLESIINSACKELGIQ